MRKRERLLLYKKLLKHYEEKNFNVICSGLCHAVEAVSYTAGLYDLPELMATKPKRPYSMGYCMGYWYAPGQTKGRITCLKKAIDMCMQKKISGRQK